MWLQASSPDVCQSGAGRGQRVLAQGQTPHQIQNVVQRKATQSKRAKRAKRANRYQVDPSPPLPSTLSCVPLRLLCAFFVCHGFVLFCGKPRFDVPWAAVARTLTWRVVIHPSSTCPRPTSQDLTEHLEFIESIAKELDRSGLEQYVFVTNPPTGEAARKNQPVVQKMPFASTASFKNLFSDEVYVCVCVCACACAYMCACIPCVPMCARLRFVSLHAGFLV
jgi:hypothetical protein